jgi:hypothetical protein
VILKKARCVVPSLNLTVRSRQLVPLPIGAQDGSVFHEYEYVCVFES